jgi:hypothetical protein
VVGERAFVNPTAALVLAEVRRDVPGFVPDEAMVRAGRRARLLRAAQWAVIAALAAVSLAAEAAGYAALGWLADGAAVASWLVFKTIRRYQR